MLVCSPCTPANRSKAWTGTKGQVVLGDQSGERLSQHDHSAELAAQQGGTLGLREAAWSGPRPTIVLDFSPSPSLTQAAAARSIYLRAVVAKL